MQEYTKTARLDASLAVFAFMYVCHFIFSSVPVGQTNLQKGLGMKMAASRIVAAKMGIDYVGCEIDEYYYAKGCEFFDREINGINPTAEGSKIIQQSLFDREQ